MGQVDFYPNGGMAPQPGCENEDPLGIDCSHARAPVSFLSIFQLLKNNSTKKNAVALKQMWSCNNLSFRNLEVFAV